MLGRESLSDKRYKLEQLSKEGENIEQYPDMIEEFEDHSIKAIDELKELRLNI
jgi:hypothetical protein